MQKHIEHELNNSIVLIPVDPSKALKVEFEPTSNNEDIGNINADVGSLSFLLHGDVKREDSKKLIRDFLNKYQEASKETEYYSTTWVVLACLIIVAIVLMFTNYESPDDIGINEIMGVQQDVEVFSPSQKTVDELLKIPDEKVMDVQNAKAQYMQALKEMESMSVEERQAYIETPQMQTLINTSWANHIQGE
jgi:hypothetical protein